MKKGDVLVKTMKRLSGEPGSLDELFAVTFRIIGESRDRRLMFTRRQLRERFPNAEPPGDTMPPRMEG